MSEDSENEQKKAETSSNENTPSEEKTSAEPASQQQKPKTAPMVGKPIGSQAVGKPIGTTVQAPRVGTPIGKPVAPPVSQTSSSAAVSRPIGTPVGTPVGSPRLTVGTPVGTPRPSIGTPVARPGAPGGQPTTSIPTVPKTPAAKPEETKVERSRRNFIKGLAIFGGIAFVASYVPLFPFLDGSVGVGSATPEQQLVQNPNLQQNQLVPITPNDVDPANGTVFQYPYVVGDSNVNSDSFVQCVLIQLPQGFSGGGYSVQDPKTGKNYIAFSRVCVHLWCLWSYSINDPRGPVMACPCHGSTYVPGSGNYSTEGFSDQLPGTAVAGPASLQTAPNNMLPIIQIKIANDGSFHAIGRVGQVGCGQKC